MALGPCTRTAPAECSTAAASGLACNQTAMHIHPPLAMLLHSSSAAARSSALLGPATPITMAGGALPRAVRGGGGGATCHRNAPLALPSSPADLIGAIGRPHALSVCRNGSSPAMDFQDLKGETLVRAPGTING